MTLNTLYATINRIIKLILFDWIMHEKVQATMQDRSCIWVNGLSNYYYYFLELSNYFII